MTDFEDFPCNELVERVTEYLEGAMTDDDRARLEHHLTLCRGCRVYVERVRTIVRASAQLGAEPIASDKRADLLATFRALKKPTHE